jgi:hypothetical protein
LAIAEGSCAHASFKNADNAQHGQYLSTTLDEIIPDGSHGDISMIHIDVEGFEQKVILGASDIIRKSKPVIIFEQHISNEDPSFIFNFLKGQGYGVYMINEVLPGNELDCRNFIAFSSSKPLPPLPLLTQHKGGEEGIWYAVPGGALINV